jgi:iron complex transport system substrate-binding protein
MDGASTIVPPLLRVIGQATGHDVSRLAASYESSLAQLRAAYAGKPKVDVFLEIWHAPYHDLGRHFMNDALEICGARTSSRTCRVSRRRFHGKSSTCRDPPVIVGAGSASSEGDFRANWNERATLSAVKAARLLWVDADTIQRPTTRTPEGVSRLCRVLDAVR